MPKVSSHQCHATLPFNLDAPEFHRAWNEYLDYRKERRLPKLVSRSVQKLWDELSDAGPEAAVQAIETSIRNGWAGVFPRRGDSGQRAGQLSGGRPAASLGALQMQLKTIETQLDEILYPGGCAHRVMPTGEKKAKAEALIKQRKAIKEKINEVSF